jgi:hypothetical protein
VSVVAPTQVSSVHAMRSSQSEFWAHVPRFAALVALAMLAALGLAGLAIWRYEATHVSEHEVLFIIPKGTAILQASGKDGPMLPKTMILTLGALDTLVIRNEDDFPARIGPFKLDSGQRYRQRFRMPGETQLICATRYHEEQVTIWVQAAPFGPGSLLQPLVALFR